MAFCRTNAFCPSTLRRVSDSPSEGAERPEPISKANTRNRGPALIITLVALVVYVQHAWAYRSLFLGNAVDDAYISFRYLDNLVAGHGLVYNPGERVEGFSNFLWILVLLPFRLAGMDVVRSSQVLGIGFGAATIALSVLAARRLFGARACLSTVFVAFLPATSGYFAAWSIGGLEGNLYAFLMLAAWFFHFDEAANRRRFPIPALLLALLAMTRPEGLFVALAGAGYIVMIQHLSGQSLRDPKVWRFLLVLGVCLGIYELFRVVTYGPHLFPNSVRAKVGLSFAAIERGVEYVHERFASPYLILLAPLFFLFRRNRYTALAPAAALVGASITLVIIAGGDWAFGRLFAPCLPLGAVALVGAVRETVGDDSSWNTRLVKPVVTLLVAGYLGFAWYVTGKLGEARFFGPFAQYDAERLRIGQWLKENAPKDAKVAVYAAGEIPYASGIYAHDMLGLNDAHIAAIEVRSFGKGIAGHEKSDPEYTLNVVKPDVIVDGYLVPGLREHPDFAKNYEQLPGFRFNAVHVKTNLVEKLLPTIPGRGSNSVHPDEP